MNKIVEWFKKAFYVPAEEPEAPKDQRDAESVFQNYYRAHLVRYDPGFMTDIAARPASLFVWTDVLSEMSSRYQVVVPAKIDVKTDSSVYSRVQAVLIAIEKGPTVFTCKPKATS